MKIATWNINSVRLRLEHIIQWLQINQIDILCLQETKVIDAKFPQSKFAEIGYHSYFAGQANGKYGVAILSKTELTDISIGFSPILGTSENYLNFDQEKRLITGYCNDIKIICVYIPSGGKVDSERYFYKLAWLNILAEYIKVSLEKNSQLWLCGDFNIAPEDKDVYEKKALNSIGVSPRERQALKHIIALGLADSLRKFTTNSGYYSWWNHRAGSFENNRGWRLDHHYLSLPLYHQVKNCWIDTTPRQLSQSSDHAPVIVEI